MAFEIYMATCPEGRRYIGCTTKGMTARWAAHTPCSRPWPGDESADIGDAIKRFGKSAFSLTLLATAETAEAARVIETAMIAHFETVGRGGYNRDRRSNIPLKPYTGPHWSRLPRPLPWHQRSSPALHEPAGG